MAVKFSNDLSSKMSVLSSGNKIQSGSSSVVIAVAGTQVTSGTITFPVAFSSAPRVFVTIQTASGNLATYINVAVPSGSSSASSFTAIGNSGVAQTIFFNWVAIGF